MILINSQFLKVANDTVQEQIDKRVNIFNAIHPASKLIKLDRGDVVRPLAPCVVKAMSEAVLEMGNEATFQGRGPSGGYQFLIDAIIKNEYKPKKIKVSEDEIFINNGSKEDLSGIGDILCRDNRIAVVDPVFQTFIESNVIGNRAGDMSEDGRWSHIIYLDCTKETDFMPIFPETRPDVVYLGYPNDPTGCVMNRETLEKWVKYAQKNEILILFDATYESFVTSKDVPHSIYEIKGARKVAIEFRSFSKNAGFTGIHCGYTIIPKELTGYSISNDSKASLNALWRQRQEIKNYTPGYIIQRGVESLFTKEGRDYIHENMEYYMQNAALLRSALASTRLKFWGGVDSPYIWVESPFESSWKLFDKLLNECQIVCSPGERFGALGTGYVRLSAFANQTKVTMAATRIADLDI